MSQYLDRREAQKSYRPKSGLMSPGLQRAREPFRLRNALTGVGLGLFAFAVYSYSIRAVKQDSFDDIDEEAKALARTGTPSGTASLPSSSAPDSTTFLPSNTAPATLDKEQEKKIMQSAFDAATGVGASKDPLKQDQSAVPISSSHLPEKRGILRRLDGKFPELLDPQNKTLVWGAPPIDNVGKISSK